jgi:F-type H+-transporting ATPase subunit b
MDLITPGIGLIFWTVVIFSILLFILGRFAWKPINNAVKTRENSIRSALLSADKARKEIEKLQAENEQIMKEAKLERDEIMREARDVKEKIISEAKVSADVEAKKIIEVARLNIQNEKAAAIKEIKEQVAILSVEIAEKILREKLKDEKAGKELVNKLINDIKLN